MRSFACRLALVAVLALSVSLARADINPYPNPGFESGLSGWTTAIDIGSATVVTGRVGSTLTYTPPVGSYFLSIMGGYGNVGQLVYRNVSLAAGDVLSGWAAWDPHETLVDHPNDSAGVRIYDGALSLLASPWYMDVNTSGAQTSIAWSLWSWTAPSAGTYRLQYYSTNYGDSLWDSFALFDDVGPPGPVPVPEPGTLVLLLVGAGPLGVWLRRRRADG